ncbi:hypothetical protein BZA05DRAFT_433019 [Tricharina praecox]|uniref:uncharacterized protein n=1 Tax=Tricharina praecox TaxID=43433 RepID=UPI00221FB343|nr:uncharacterized protein BZA05DRAFT_433019 [Tricharina praecox]KAI5857555.1 hypothetical protein BZA05DRAFT_433019 [Tricharina praecox]
MKPTAPAAAAPAALLLDELATTATALLLAFWLPSAAYLLAPALFPALTAQYKTQPSAPPPTPQELAHCALVVARNQLLGLAVQAAVHILLFSTLGVGPYPPSPSPRSPIHTALTLALCIPLCELLFYAFHLLLHQPWLFRRVHRVHHAFTAPVALAAHYCHWIEFVLTWYVPVMLPPMLVQASVREVGVWVAIVAGESAGLHSGFSLGKMGGGTGVMRAMGGLGGLVERHDRHHMKGVQGGYGTFELLDWVFGTQLRDVSLASLNPLLAD